MSQSWKTAYVSTIILKTISDPDFNLDQVKGSVVISEEVIMPALQITIVKSSHKCTNVFVLGNTSELKPGNSDIEVVIQNRSGKDMNLKPGTEIGMVIAANIIPTMQVSNDFDVDGPERVSSMSG